MYELIYSEYHDGKMTRGTGHVIKTFETFMQAALYIRTCIEEDFESAGVTGYKKIYPGIGMSYNYKNWEYRFEIKRV